MLAPCGDKVGIISRLFRRERSADTPFALHRAVQRAGEREVAALLDAGANPDLPDDLGMTPLLWAVYGGYANITELLCRAGADVNLRGSNGETALWHAEDDFGLWEVAAVLRRHGATEK